MFNNSCQKKACLFDCVEHEWQHGLQPRESGRGIGSALLLDGVGRVVGGDAVDHVEVLPQRVAVLLRHQVRPHLQKKSSIDFRDPDPDPTGNDDFFGI